MGEAPLSAYLLVAASNWQVLLVQDCPKDLVVLKNAMRSKSTLCSGFATRHASLSWQPLCGCQFSGALGQPQFLQKRSENVGANENLSCGFPSIPGIAPGVAPRIVVLVLFKSWDAIPRMELRIPRIPRNSPRAPRMAFSLREHFSWNWGGPRASEFPWFYRLSPWKKGRRRSKLGVSSGTLRNPQPLVLSQKFCRYKRDAYCGTNRGRRIAVQLGGVLRDLPFFKA